MFKGSLVALVTPLTANGEPDLVTLKALLDWHITSGTTGVVILGSTGEAPAFEPAEKDKILSAAIEHVAGRIPVIAGTGHNATAVTIAQSQRAVELGADGCLVVTPFYNKPPQRGLIQHYQAVADATDKPIILYNVPSRSGCDLIPQTVAELAQHQNIVGIKEAVGTTERYSELRQVTPADFVLLSGDDPTYVECLKAGGDGIISVTANIAPRAMINIFLAAQDNAWDECAKQQQKLAQVHENLFVESNPIPVKWALFKMGRIKSDELRLPLVKLASQYQDKLHQTLSQANLL